MTLLTKDAQHQAGLAVTIHRRRKPFEITGVTFQTAGNNVLIKMGRTIGVAGTVHPTVGCSPVSDGQLEELVSFPEQIALPFSGKACHYVDALGAGNFLGRRNLLYRALKISLFVDGHLERQIGVGRLQKVGA